jgi:hypothetical protein
MGVTSSSRRYKEEIYDSLRRQAGEPNAAKARRPSVPSFPRSLHDHV